MSVAVKICGIASPDAMAAALDGGARYVGLVFYPPSPRAISPIQAAGLASKVPGHVAKVGLVVDADDATLGAILQEVKLDLLQLHGSETPQRVAEIKRKFKLPAMKAVKIASAADVEDAARFVEIADRLLFDAQEPKGADALPGGNGIAFDWDLLAKKQWPLPWMLSGGLTADNLPQAVAVTEAACVDVSSGVEERRGVKSPEKIARFLAVAKSL
jgi:phosphoribosylanthranilate isomerase